MRVYRGTRDILPHELNHRRLSPAVYGTATYYALHESDGFHYAQGGYSECQVVTTYELSLNNVLTITDQDWSEIGVFSDAKKPIPISTRMQELLDYQQKELSPVNLAKVAQQSGYQAVLLQGVIEGGSQLVIPENEVRPEVVSYQIKMAKELCGHSKEQDSANQFIELLEQQGVSLQVSNYYLEFTLTPTQLNNLIPIFEFLKTTRRKSFYSVNFMAQTVEPYEDE